MPKKPMPDFIKKKIDAKGDKDAKGGPKKGVNPFAKKPGKK